MPTTALGRYEVAVTTGKPGETPERLVKTFVYVPCTRILATLFVLAAVVFLVRRPWRRWTLSDRWWLWLLVVVAAAVYLAGNLLADFYDGLTAMACGELLAVAAALSFLCRCRRRLRAGLFFLALATNLAFVFAMTTIASGGWEMARYMLVTIALLSLFCVAAVALGCITVRRVFSAARLLRGFALGAVGAMVCFTLLMHFAEGMPLELEHILPACLIVLP